MDNPKNTFALYCGYHLIDAINVPGDVPIKRSFIEFKLDQAHMYREDNYWAEVTVNGEKDRYKLKKTLNGPVLCKRDKENGGYHRI